VQFRLAGGHVLFPVTVLRKAARSAEIHGEEQKKTGDPASHGAAENREEDIRQASRIKQ
jgi:hypothetical protein